MTALPSARRRILGAALRRYRQELGYTLDDAARFLECDRSKISRIETGQRGIRNSELHALLAEYRVEKQTQETLAVIASPRGISGWRQAHGHGLPDAYADMIALEMAASRIMVYEANQIPDLLQSDEYRYALGCTSADLRQSSASAYQIRQDIAPGKVRPEITAVIGESALVHMPGGPTVIRAQLAALASAKSRFPVLRMQVLLSEKGAHSARGVGSFMILHYDQVPGLQVVCLRGITGGILVEDQQEVTAYESAFQQLSVSALTLDASATLINCMHSEPAVKQLSNTSRDTLG